MAAEYIDLPNERRNPMELTVAVSAGQHARSMCPVSCEVDGTWHSAVLLDAETGTRVPCQPGDGKVSWIVDDLPAGREKTYTLKDSPSEDVPGMTVKQGDDSMDVLLGDQLFTTYHYEKDRVRPFLNPVIGPTGVSMVRELFDEENPPEHDHIHHKGMLSAHGDVNGADNWSEVQDRNATQVHKQTDSVVSGPVYGRIAVTNDWLDKPGEHVVLERRVMTFWNVQGAARLIDFDVTFLADTQDVTFGDTKEGGILSIRVPTPLRVDQGGAMRNCYGGVGEEECWGKRAHWCDYVGVLEGKKVGVAVFDHPTSFRHPTYWHIRNYGLFAANPFGLSYYYNDKSRDGSHTLKKGENLSFSYRVYIHEGNTRAGGVADAYHNFVNNPKVEV